MIMNKLVIELLQISLGNRSGLSHVPTGSEWVLLYQMAQKQTILGVLSTGLECLPESQRPPKDVLLKWIAQVYQTDSRNAQLSKACYCLSEELEKAGFYVCFLKGQANHAYYPVSMANKRACGDIDVWVAPSCGDKHPIKSVINYLETRYEMVGLCWLHACMLYKDNISVEVHFRPSFMNEPLRNWRFQKHFNDIKQCICLKEVDGRHLSAMKVDEDVIYQMNHIYRHLIDEGVGLRQVVDYYFLLRAWSNQHTRTKEETMRIVSWLGMKRFAGALMYVLRETCGMSAEFFLCPASIKDGRFLLDEVMQAGNFGHGDTRMEAVKGSEGRLRYQLGHEWWRIKRNMRFLSSYPGEVIWEPCARARHYGWKKFGVWK